MRLSVILLALPLGLSACNRTSRPRSEASPADTAFRTMQARGAAVMGVDQYTSRHVFEDLPDGGRIVLERDTPADTPGIAEIRRHMQHIARAFALGDFADPLQVHAMTVPGTDIMTARRGTITYQELDRPRGAEVRIHTTDSAAVAAVHEFLGFQRHEHHAAGHEGAPAHVP
jgi:hypothetical protein